MAAWLCLKICLIDVCGWALRIPLRIAKQDTSCAAGAIAISLIIVWRWGALVLEQARKIVGFSAPKEFLDKIRTVANSHDGIISTDTIRAYFSGVRKLRGLHM